MWLHIDHVGRTWLLGSSQNKMDTPLNVLYVKHLYLCLNVNSSPKKTYLLSTNDGKGSWTPRMHLRHREGAKLASSKIMSRSYFYSSYSYYCQKGSFYDTTVMVHVVDTTIYLIRTNCAYS